MSLYSKNALFFGSTTPLYKGKDVAAYFNALRRLKSPAVQFTDLVVAPSGSHVINVAATAFFVVSESAPPVSFRLIWVAIREDNTEIVSHHVSPKVAPK